MITELITHLLADASLANLCGTRIKPGIAGEGTARPYVVLQRVAREPDHTADGPGLNIPIFQIDAYADDLLTADNVGKAVIAALDGKKAGDIAGVNLLYAALNGSATTFETATRLHRVRNDFRIRARS